MRLGSLQKGRRSWSQGIKLMTNLETEPAVAGANARKVTPQYTDWRSTRTLEERMISAPEFVPTKASSHEGDHNTPELVPTRTISNESAHHTPYTPHTSHTSTSSSYFKFSGVPARSPSATSPPAKSSNLTGVASWLELAYQLDLPAEARLPDQVDVHAALDYFNTHWYIPEPDPQGIPTPLSGLQKYQAQLSDQNYDACLRLRDLISLAESRREDVKGPGAASFDQALQREFRNELVRLAFRARNILEVEMDKRCCS
ncbi:hypothetical protein MMC25_001682 [Agyrium rufum]|nr:hypothetical protein [Agyrium rufum]